MKPLLNYITNDITIRNNADLEMKSVYLCVYSRFSLICLLFMNIHEHANEIIFMYDHWMQGLSYHIGNDIISCKNGDFGMKSVDLWVLFTISPHVLKISLLFMNMQIT